MSDDSKNSSGKTPNPEEALSGNFELLEELGRGSTGTVYRARLTKKLGELPADSEVAIKFLRSDLLADPAAHARLAAEGRLGRKIRSAHVVRIHTVETMELLGMPVTYLVMELIEGHNLREVLDESGSVVEDLARRIGLDAARGLRALHNYGLLHRDVKPENLALTDAGTVKLMDLGLAHRVSRRGRAAVGSGFHGSLSYAAPEVLAGRPATQRSDLYSLGVVLFEIVTGRHPFAAAGPDSDAIIDAHLKQAPPRPSHEKPRLSPFLEHLILDLLAKEPAGRPRSAAELEVTLRRGENSRYWLRHERRAPRLASRRRLRAMHRAADVAFVGRFDELRELDRLLRRANSGRGCAVYLSGQRRMGRRRLLEHWLDGLLEREADVTFLGGEALGGPSQERAAPFTDMLFEWFLRGDRPDSPNAQARLTARIAADSPLEGHEVERLAAFACGEDPRSSPEERADLLARQLLAMIPRGHTTVLRIDLAEQLSTTAELVVRRVIDEIESHRLLLIVVTIDKPEPRSGLHHLELPGMSKAEFTNLAAELFAAGEVPEVVIRAGHGILAGSPGNLIDALARLASQGQIEGAPGAYRVVGRIDSLPPPGSMLDQLRDRLTGLTRQQQFVHAAAAVLGNTFPIADLAVMVGQSELAVLEALSVFRQRIILTRRGVGRFRHRDFRNVMLESVAPAVLRQLHRTAAWTLEDRGAPRLEVGLHLSRSGEHAAAVAPLLDGLAHLTATGSRQNGLRVCDRLRVHLDALPPADYAGERLRFALLRGRAEELAGAGEAATASYGEASSLAQDSGRSCEAGAAKIALARLDLGVGRFPAALARADEAEDLLRRGPEDKAALARVLHLRGRVLGYLGRSDEALRAVRDGLRIVPDDVPNARPHLLVDLARLEALRTHFVAAQKSLDRADELFRITGANRGVARAMLHRGHVLATIGDRESATRLLLDAWEQARRLSDPRAQGKAELFLGEQAVWHGDVDGAVAHLESSIELAGGVGDRVTLVQARLYLAAAGVQADNAGLQQEVEALGLPALQLAWLLATAGDDEAAMAQAMAIEREFTVPLHLRRALLMASGRGPSARRLTDEVASRLPAGGMRRRFVAFVKG